MTHEAADLVRRASKEPTSRVTPVPELTTVPWPGAPTTASINSEDTRPVPLFVMTGSPAEGSSRLEPELSEPVQ